MEWARSKHPNCIPLRQPVLNSGAKLPVYFIDVIDIVQVSEQALHQANRSTEHKLGRYGTDQA